MMNEQIKELHAQAYLHALHNETKAREGGCHEPGTFNNDYREKFAELIVRECMNIVSNQTTLDTNEDFREGFNHGLKYAWTDIRKHFGIK
jgi:hypothetical protein